MYRGIHWDPVQTSAVKHKNIWHRCPGWNMASVTDCLKPAYIAGEDTQQQQTTSQANRDNHGQEKTNRSALRIKFPDYYQPFWSNSLGRRVLWRSPRARPKLPQKLVFHDAWPAGSRWTPQYLYYDLFCDLAFTLSKDFYLKQYTTNKIEIIYNELQAIEHINNTWGKFKLQISSLFIPISCYELYIMLQID